VEKINIEKVNEVYLKVYCEAGTAAEISEYFTFEVPGARFMPAYRNRMWDGKIRLFSQLTRSLYVGLIHHLQRFCDERGYELEYSNDFHPDEFSLKEAQEFVNELNPTMVPRDYQMDAFVYAVRHRRAVMLSPTASGKSFIIYLLARWYNLKTLIVVPTTSLVHQMSSDFVSYGYKDDIHRITAGVDKQSNHQFVVTTWQSIYKMPKQWFSQFGMVIGDEAHLFKAKSLSSIMEKLVDCKYRFGFTGTLDGTQTHKLVLEGLFGSVRKVTSTAELIEQKHLSSFNIKCVVLKYPDAICQALKNATYQDEMDFLVRNENRNRFIKNLSLSLNGNTLLLFQYVDKHGQILYDMIKDNQVPTFFVHGGVEGTEREEIRKIVDAENKSIIIASYGTFSTGINIRNLHNIIFASPSKSKIRNLQSIGRGLRKSETKDQATLYDIADDLSWKSRKNHTIGHFVERCKIYDEEKFEYKIYTTRLKI
jgi:superfamily II DNA or RNA helicase